MLFLIHCGLTNWAEIVDYIIDVVLTLFIKYM